MHRFGNRGFDWACSRNHNLSAFAKWSSDKERLSVLKKLLAALAAKSRHHFFLKSRYRIIAECIGVAKRTYHIVQISG